MLTSIPAVDCSFSLPLLRMASARSRWNLESGSCRVAPETLHKRIGNEFDAVVPFELPADESLLLASHCAAVLVVELTPEAFMEPVRVCTTLLDGRPGLTRSVRLRAPPADLPGCLGCPPGRLPASRRTRRSAGRYRDAGMRTAFRRDRFRPGSESAAAGVHLPFREF